MIKFIVLLLLFIASCECLIFDKKSLPKDYISDGLKLHDSKVTTEAGSTKSPSSTYKPVKTSNKDYEYDYDKPNEPDIEEEFVPIRDHEKDSKYQIIDKNNDPVNDPSESISSIRTRSKSNNEKNWKIEICEEFLLRESGMQKIPKALRYHVDIDDHKRLNTNPTFDKREMAKCLRNLEKIKSDDAKGDNKFAGLSDHPNSVHPFSQSAGWSNMMPNQPANSPQDKNRAKIISRLSEEQIRRLLMLLTELLDKKMRPPPGLGKVPIHGKLTPMMYSDVVGIESPRIKGPPTVMRRPSSSSFPSSKYPFGHNGLSMFSGGSVNPSIGSQNGLHYGNVLGFNPSDKPGLLALSPHQYQYHPLAHHNHHHHHPATMVHRFPFTSPNGVKKLLINEVLGVKNIEKYNGEREVEVGGDPKTVVIHEGELHVDPTGDSEAIEIGGGSTKMRNYRDTYLTTTGQRIPGLSGHSSRVSEHGRPPTSSRYGRPDSFDWREPGNQHIESHEDLSSYPKLPDSYSSPPIEPGLSSPGNPHYHPHHHHDLHQHKYQSNDGEPIYHHHHDHEHNHVTGTPQPMTSLHISNNNKANGEGDQFEESIKSKYKANNSATKVAYGKYGAKYLGLTLTSIANYALGNLIGVLYAPFMKNRDNKEGKGSSKKGKRPSFVSIVEEPFKHKFKHDSHHHHHHNHHPFHSHHHHSPPTTIDQEIENLIDDDEDLEGDR